MLQCIYCFLGCFWEGYKIKNDTILAVLSAIEIIGKPVGANTLMRALEQTEIQVSFATAGRMLAELENKGFLFKEKKKTGRILSEQGKLYLSNLRQELRNTDFAFGLVEKMMPRDQKMIIDVLIARLAIERQIGRLAAEDVTDEELQELQDCVLRGQAAADWNDVVNSDNEFHSRIASIAGNSVLEAVLTFIKQDTEIPAILAFVRKQEGYSFGKDHIEIVSALETRNPDYAEEAISSHIQKIIDDINIYFSRKKRIKMELPDILNK